MKSAQELKVYEASKEALAINQRYAKELNLGELTEEDSDRWQLDLIYLHFENMDEATQRRARQTIKFLQQRINQREAA